MKLKMTKTCKKKSDNKRMNKNKNYGKTDMTNQCKAKNGKHLNNENTKNEN